MKYLYKLSLISFLATLPILGFAHGGHGVMTGSSLIHYLLSPMHVVPVLIGVIVLIVYLKSKKRTSSK